MARITIVSAAANAEMDGVVRQHNFQHNSTVLRQITGYTAENSGTEFTLHRWNGVRISRATLELFPLQFVNELNRAVAIANSHRSLALERLRRVKPVPETVGRTFIFKKSMEPEGYPHCTICMEHFKSREKVRQLHGSQCSFHWRCLKKWFKHHSTCPNCGLDCGVVQ
tara:strand:+ start:1056 stop:1559 length:504 start_codon:yes stop_codon:yes gene_type:complete